MATRKRSSAKKTTRKTPSSTSVKRDHAKPSPAARAKAAQLATRMPFVHFPAKTKFSEWKTWTAFKSPLHLNKPPKSSDLFDVLRATHVFAYAGPCCFAAPGHGGDAVAYLKPDADQRWPGEASPFDSGSLEGDDARLQNWAEKPKAVRWKFFQQHVHPFARWRAEFERWLLNCYESPERYLESGADRYAAGEPDRTRPSALLQYNGTRGRARADGRDCADRRAWTWEVRFSEPIPFDEIRLLHVPADRLQAVSEANLEQRFGTGRDVDVLSLPSDVSPSPDALYLYSHEALEEIIGS